MFWQAFKEVASGQIKDCDYRYFRQNGLSGHLFFYCLAPTMVALALTMSIFVLGYVYLVPCIGTLASTYLSVLVIVGMMFAGRPLLKKWECVIERMFYLQEHGQ